MSNGGQPRNSRRPHHAPRHRCRRRRRRGPTAPHTRTRGRPRHVHHRRHVVLVHHERAPQRPHVEAVAVGVLAGDDKVHGLARVPRQRVGAHRHRHLAQRRVGAQVVDAHAAVGARGRQQRRVRRVEPHRRHRVGAPLVRVQRVRPRRVPHVHAAGAGGKAAGPRRVRVQVREGMLAAPHRHGRHAAGGAGVVSSGAGAATAAGGGGLPQARLQHGVLRRERLLRRHAPLLDAAVVAAGEERVAVRRHGQPAHEARVRVHGPQLLLRGQVPHDRLAVGGARHERHERLGRRGGAVHAVRVLAERRHERLGEHAVHLGGGDGAHVLARLLERVQLGVGVLVLLHDVARRRAHGVLLRPHDGLDLHGGRGAIVRPGPPGGAARAGRPGI
jgi:hypothetical protein